MITIKNLCKAYKAHGGWNQVLDDVSAVFPDGRNVGILGLNGSGKSTLLRLIGGAESPDSGQITKNVRTSWPIGFSGGFQKGMTGREGARFVSRVYGANVRTTEKYVGDFAELGPYFDMPISTYSSGMRGRLNFAISMALSFDCYLVDEVTAAGDRRFREKYRAAFEELGKRASMIMVSHQSSTIQQYCDMAAVLHDGKLDLYDSLDEGMKVYESISAERRALRARPRRASEELH